jgi:hypothetical protein
MNFAEHKKRLLDAIRLEMDMLGDERLDDSSFKHISTPRKFFEMAKEMVEIARNECYGDFQDAIEFIREIRFAFFQERPKATHFEYVLRLIDLEIRMRYGIVYK